jgi:hypothetical protein
MRETNRQHKDCKGFPVNSIDFPMLAWFESRQFAGVINVAWQKPFLPVKHRCKQAPALVTY